MKYLHKVHGFIQPELIVEDAKGRNSPLHDYFEWDNEVAGANYRLDQARYLIQSIAVVSVENEESRGEVRFYYSVEDSDGTSKYVSLDTVLSNESYRDQVVAYAKEQLVGWRKRYHLYKEFEPVIVAIDQLNA